jgi:hypothetical protein
MIQPEHIVANSISGAVHRHRVEGGIALDDRWLTPAVCQRLARSIIDDLNRSGFVIMKERDSAK